MKSRRDRMEVIYDILAAIEKEGGSMKPTRLMYRSNLSYNLMKSYMAELKEKGMIAEVVVKKRRFIALTESGRQFMVQLRKMRKFLDSFGL